MIKITKPLILPLALVISIIGVGADLFAPLYVLWLISAFIVAYFISNIIHETAHYTLFKIYKRPVVELSFGVFRLFFIDGRIEPLFTPNLPFNVLCSCKGLREISQLKRSICLLVGGLSNLVLALILIVLYFLLPIQRHEDVIWVLIAACIANSCINAINPNSADRKLLRRLSKEEKTNHKK